MEGRKRSHSDDEEPVSTKKRAITGPNGSPYVNGHTEELTEQDQVELFRKDAIFRRMKHYSRQYERSQLQIAELERRKTSCEAGLAAISACWTQIIATIHSLARPDALPDAPKPSAGGLFAIREYLSGKPPAAVDKVLNDTRQATQNLVSRFLELGGEPTVRLLQDASFIKDQNARSEAAVLRSELDIIRSRLQESEEEKRKLRVEVSEAQSRIDRLNSKAINPPKQPMNHKIESDSTHPSPTPTPSPHPNIQPHDQSAWENLAKFRDDQIHTLNEEIRVLKEGELKLKLLAHNPSPEIITSSGQYQVLATAFTQTEEKCKEAEGKVAALMKEVTLLQEQQLRDSSTPHSVTQELSDLNAAIQKRDADLTRVRESRDQLAAEVNERKQRDSVKMTSLSELKLLTGSQSERISVLQSQLRRYRVQLSAQAGSQELISFFLGGEDQVRYVETLRRRAETAEGQISALEQSLSSFGATNPDLAVLAKREAELLQQVSNLSDEISRYSSAYGAAPDSRSDTSKLVATLKEKDTELQVLRLKDRQHDESQRALETEVDKLSAAWETLEKQNVSKVFDLTAAEERVSKSALERAKTENKYYAAMRDKEAIETERKLLVRTAEKQSKTIDKLLASEALLTPQVLNLEKLLLAKTASYESVEAKAKELFSQRNAYQSYVEEENRRRMEREKDYKGKILELMDARDKAKREREVTIMQRKELENTLEANKKAKAASHHNSSAAELALRQEYDQAMELLKCSTCKQRFRNTILGKCQHTFCKECVDARITTRQRKCPYCQLAFGVADVQTLRLQ